MNAGIWSHAQLGKTNHCFKATWRGSQHGLISSISPASWTHFFTVITCNIQLLDLNFKTNQNWCHQEILPGITPFKEVRYDSHYKLLLQFPCSENWWRKRAIAKINKNPQITLLIVKYSITDTVVYQTNSTIKYSSNPLPWARAPPTRPGCFKPHLAWL